MNREKGVSSLALVLMLLVLGSLLLQGMSQQDRSFCLSREHGKSVIAPPGHRSVGAGVGENALLQTQPAVQCSQYAGTMPGFVCVYWQIMKPYWLPVMKRSLW